MIKRQVANSAWVLFFDSLVLLFALLIGNVVLWFEWGLPVSLKYSLFLIPLWGLAAAIAGLLPGWGLGAVEELRRIEISVAVVFATAGVGTLMLRVAPSRIVFLVAYLVSAVCLPLGRMLCTKLLKRYKAWGCPAVVYGDRETVSRILSVLNTESVIGHYPMGIFSDELEEGDVVGVPVLGGLHETTRQASVAIASLVHLRKRDLVQFVDHTLAGYRKVILIPDMDESMFAWVTPRNFSGLIGLEVTRNLLNPFAAALKRVLELMLVWITAPVWMGLIALLALTSIITHRANPFYAQLRVGKNGRRFHAWKFRTMVPDADKKLADILAQDATLKAEWDKYYKLKNDPRITPVGGFLRKYSLDELPQLFNVLRGQMALVGPRPLPEYHDEALSEKARLPRNSVQPGMTGMWQVSGRSDMDVEEMERLDTYYVRNWSIWLDLYILIRTIVVVLRSRGAY